MTHVVTEACIRCKYTDCVDVCPVDCFREGPNFLAIDPDGGRTQETQLGRSVGIDHFDEIDLREARLDLAEARAGVSGDHRDYGAAWQAHIAWLERTHARSAEDDVWIERSLRRRVLTFLRRHAWPPGTTDRVEQTFARYLHGSLGWVSALESGPAGIKRVHLVFGGTNKLETGRERDLFRGSEPVSVLRILEVEGEGRFVVATRGARIVGCAELAPLSHEVAEVRSLVVDRQARGLGLALRMVERLSSQARAEGFDRLCAFAHDAGFFVRLGFSIVPHTWVPEKIAHDCAGIFCR